MNHYAITQLAETRREQLIAEATIYRQTRRHRSRAVAHSASRPRRPFSAFSAWVAAGQL